MRLRIGRGESADADTILLRKNNAVNQNILVTAMVNVFEVVAALRAQLAFDVDAIVAFDFRPEFGRNQMQRLFVHRAVFDRINGAVTGARPLLEAAFEHGDDSGFAAAHRAHQQKNSLSNFEALAG